MPLSTNEMIATPAYQKMCFLRQMGNAIAKTKADRVTALLTQLVQTPALNASIDAETKGVWLLAAAQNGWMEASSLLIQAGANVHCADKKGNTALHSTLFYSVSLTRLLIQQGASATRQNEAGQSAINITTNSFYTTAKLNPFLTQALTTNETIDWNKAETFEQEQGPQKIQITGCHSLPDGKIQVRFKM